MPISMQTEKNVVAATSHSERIFSTTLNMVKAASKILGSNYSIISDVENDTGHTTQYFVPTKEIGYPDFGMFFESFVHPSSSSYHKIRCGIVGVSSDGMSPDMSDPSNIFTARTGLAAPNTMPLCPETCALVCDSTKDTVLIDIHPGETLHGTDWKDMKIDGGGNFDSQLRCDPSVFFAKDVNGGVLCGIGMGHVFRLRSLTSMLDYDEHATGVPPMEVIINSDFLQLTKMVNYLSEGYPEMKSAYISVTRPYDASTDRMYVPTLYANGKRWARAGLSGTQDTSDINAYCFQPFEPFVNY